MDFLYMLSFKIRKDYWRYEYSIKGNTDILEYFRIFPLSDRGLELWVLEYGSSDGYSI